ncbi:MAG: hypothetical protein AB7P00_23680, partial [Sandaracinaceae bacterium]
MDRGIGVGAIGAAHQAAVESEVTRRAGLGESIGIITAIAIDVPVAVRVTADRTRIAIFVDVGRVADLPHPWVAERIVVVAVGVPLTTTARGIHIAVAVSVGIGASGIASAIGARVTRAGVSARVERSGRVDTGVSSSCVGTGRGPAAPDMDDTEQDPPRS